MKRFIALAMLLAIAAIVSTGCPRKLPIEGTLADAPVQTVVK